MKCSVTVTAEVTNSILSFLLQLFRRVAAALPGMESMQETSKEGSILSVSSKPKQFINSDPMSKCSALVCNQVTLLHSTSYLIIYKSIRTDWVLGNACGWVLTFRKIIICVWDINLCDFADLNAQTACNTPKRKENVKSHHMTPLILLKSQK